MIIHTITNFIRYGLVGVIVNLFLYILYLVLTNKFAVSPAIATTVVYVLGIGLSFFANKSWSFQSQSENRDVFPRYVATYLAGYLMQVTALLFLTDFVRLDHAFAQLAAMGSAMVIIFLLLKFWVFRERQPI